MPLADNNVFVRDLEIPAGDGYPLTASLHTCGTLGPPVVIAPAPGVTADFYRSFAEHLARNGYSVLSFDYRGTGRSKPDRLRGFECTLDTWGNEDLAGVIAWCRHAGLGRPNVVAHGVSGRLLLEVPNLRGVKSVTLVACDLRGAQDMTLGQRLAKMAAKATLPLVERLFGYVPGVFLGKRAESLPAGVVRQWLSYDEPVAGRSLRRLPGPALAIGIDDDQRPDPVHRLVGRAPDGRIRPWLLATRDPTHGRLDRNGFFRPASAALWPALVQWLQSPERSNPAQTTQTFRRPKRAPMAKLEPAL